MIGNIEFLKDFTINLPFNKHNYENLLWIKCTIQDILVIFNAMFKVS